MIKWLLSLFRGKIIDDGEVIEEPAGDEFQYMLKVSCREKYYYTEIKTDRLSHTVNYKCVCCGEVVRLTHPGYLWVMPKVPDPILTMPLLSWGGHGFSIVQWHRYNYASTVQPDTYPRHYPGIPG